MTITAAATIVTTYRTGSLVSLMADVKSGAVVTYSGSSRCGASEMVEEAHRGADGRIHMLTRREGADRPAWSADYPNAKDYRWVVERVAA